MKTLLFYATAMLFITSVATAQNATFDISNETFTGLIAASPLAIDINGDNIEDLFNNGYDPSDEQVKSIFYTNDGSANFTVDGMIVSAFSMGDAIKFDGDNDGDNDFFYTGGTLSGNVIGYLENLGNGNFSSKTCNNLNDYALYSVTISYADTDLDGDIDLFLSGFDSNGEELAYLLLNDGDGCFSLSTQEFEGVWNGGSALADLDNNGFPDLVYFGSRNNDGFKSVRLNTGGIFGNSITITGLPDIIGGKMDSGFIDTDPFIDLAISVDVANVGPKSMICFGNGDGTFNCVEQVLPQVSNGSILLEDFDLDGDLDLLINGKLFNSNETRITKLMLNDGNGIFTNSNQTFTGVYNGKPIAIYANDDAYLDIFIAGDAGFGFPLNEPTAELYINTTPLGVEHFTQDKVAVYPNPTHGIVNVELSNDVFVTNYSITDMSGKQFKVSNHGTEIDFSGLQAGMYLLTLNTEKGSVTKRIIKN